jgi:protein TonB
MVSDAGAIVRPTIEATLGDPFARVLALGARDRARFARSLVATLMMYAGGVVAGFATSTDLHAFAADVLHAVIRARSVLEIELAPPPPEPPPEEKPPEPEEKPPKEEEPPPPANAPPPAPAQAGKVLTADPDPDEPVDLTGNTFVQGTGDTFAGGVTSSTGTSKTAVREASPVGSADAPPSKAVAPGPAAPDRSREATPLSGSWNDCGFPAEADIEQINNARVVLSVTVSADGQAKSATVIQDPGYGFGALAKRCALRKSYRPALDRTGNSTTATQVVKINFLR